MNESFEISASYARIRELESLLSGSRKERNELKENLAYRDSLIDTQTEKIEELERIIDNMTVAEDYLDCVYIVSEGTELYAIYKYLQDAVEAADNMNKGIYMPRQLHTISKYKLKEGIE